MAYHRCISSLGCPDATLPQALDLAAAHGLEALELRSLGGRIDLPRYFTEQHGSPRQLASFVSRHPVRIASMDTSLRLFSNSGGDRDAFLEFVPWAEALGVPWLRVFDGGSDAVAEMAAACETWRWWRELKTRQGWACDLIIETHDALRDSEAILALTAACPGIRILWDSHHTWKVGGEDPVATWQAIRDHVVHIHVKESVSRPSSHHPFSYVLPGRGEFPMADLQPVLAAEFTGTVSLEWECFWHRDLPPVEEALKAAATAHWW